MIDPTNRRCDIRPSPCAARLTRESCRNIFISCRPCARYLQGWLVGMLHLPRARRSRASQPRLTSAPQVRAHRCDALLHSHVLWLAFSPDRTIHRKCPFSPRDDATQVLLRNLPSIRLCNGSLSNFISNDSSCSDSYTNRLRVRNTVRFKLSCDWAAAQPLRRPQRRRSPVRPVVGSGADRSAASVSRAVACRRAGYNGKNWTS